MKHDSLHHPALEQALLEEMLGALITIRPDGEIVSWNARAEALFGYAAAEVIGRSVFETIIPADQMDEKRHWLEAAAASGSVVYEGVRRRKDGMSVYVDVVAKALRDENGQSYVILNERDTTPIKYRREAQVLQARFGGVLEAAPDAIVIVDRGGRVALVNPETERLFGYTRDELLGQPIDLLVPERFRGAHSVHRVGYFVDPRTRSMGSDLSLSARRKDRSEFPVEISLSPLGSGTDTMVIASIRDVSEQRRTEARFRALLEAAPDAMVIVDRAGRIALVNSRVEQLFGYTRAELLDQPVDILVPARVRGGHQAHRTRYFSDPHPRPMGSSLELWGHRKDGSEFPVEISLSPVETKDGTLVTAAIRDISERVKHEKHRRETSEGELRRESAARRELQDYLDATSTLNVKVTPEGTILLANRIAQESSRLSLESVLVTPFRDGPWWSWDPDVRGRVTAAFDQACDGTAVTLEEKLWLFDAPVEVSLSLVPIAARDGRVAYVVVEARDISRLLAAEQRLRAANRELEAFTYSVSHDLRAPLRQIDGFSKVLREQIGAGLNERGEHFLRRIEEGTHHMGRLVDDLLHLARVGQQDVRSSPTSLDGLVREVVEGLQVEESARQIEWRLDPLPSLRCDEGLVRVVFTNLLSNAVKYTRPREQAVVEVGWIDRAGEPVLFVRDNGVGFDMKYADKLFGVFQRLHRAEQFEGTGVGLATVQRIVHKHGGTIWAEAELDRGATFFFTLGQSSMPKPQEVS